MRKPSIAAFVITIMVAMPFEVFATNPCVPIAEACMQAGYYKDGHKVGKGLVQNCIMPVVAHNKTLPQANFSEEVLTQCKAMLVEKIRS